MTISFTTYIKESECLDQMKVAANELIQSFRFGRSEGVAENGRWMVFVGENDPKVLANTLTSLGYEFFTDTDDETGSEYNCWMKGYIDLQITKVSRIIATGTLVGFEISIYSEQDDIDALGLQDMNVGLTDTSDDVPMEGVKEDDDDAKAGDGDTSDDSYTDDQRSAQ